MLVSQAFPSEYLKAADLKGRNVRVVIERVEMRDIGDDHKPVVFFQGHDKGCVLNKTNSNNIAEELEGFSRELAQLSDEIRQRNLEPLESHFNEANQLYQTLKEMNRS